MATICLRSSISPLSFESPNLTPNLSTSSSSSPSSISVLSDSRLLNINAMRSRYILNHPISGAIETPFAASDKNSQLKRRNGVRNIATAARLDHGKTAPVDATSKQAVATRGMSGNKEFNELTCTSILRTCATPQDLFLGRQVHAFAIKFGAYEDVVMGTALICMYSKCGCLIDAERVFDKLPHKDVQCLNTMILEYGRSGSGVKSLDGFLFLMSSGLEPNEYTYTNVISSCGQNLCLAEGKQLHGLAIKSGYVCEISVGNTVITMYAKSGLMEESEKMFSGMGATNLISWTALISGYAQNGYFERAFVSFLEMTELEMHIDCGCWSTLLDACSESHNYILGLQLHGSMVKLGLLYDVRVGTALVDFYAKNRNLTAAKLAFARIPGNSIAAFNAVLVGFIKSAEDGEDLMRIFNQQRLAGMVPDMVTLLSFLSYCALHACLMQGQALHAYTLKTGIDSELNVGNALITMYAKCGMVEDACVMFHCMRRHDIVSWNSMISAFALSGQGNRALLSFEEMKKQGYAPDGITLLAILQGCRYSGLLNDGLQLFVEMESKYGVRPVLEHYACVVDLLGRIGLLSEAVDFISRCPFSDSVMLWRTLANICKLCRDISVGKLASRRLLDLEPADASSHILVSNMYAGEGMFDEAAKVRTIMTDLKVSKETGCSWIEIDSKLHQFMANNKDHPALLDVLGLS